MAFTSRTDSMAIAVKHIRKSALPNFVFPDERRPPKHHSLRKKSNKGGGKNSKSKLKSAKKNKKKTNKRKQPSSNNNNPNNPTPSSSSSSSSSNANNPSAINQQVQPKITKGVGVKGSADPDPDHKTASGSTHTHTDHTGLENGGNGNILKKRAIGSPVISPSLGPVGMSGSMGSAPLVPLDLPPQTLDHDQTLDRTRN